MMFKADVYCMWVNTCGKCLISVMAVNHSISVRLFQPAGPGPSVLTVPRCARAHMALPATTSAGGVAAHRVTQETAVSRVSVASLSLSLSRTFFYVTLFFLSAACLPGTFGPNCNRVCQCSERNQLCHPVSGECYCAPGYTGPKCDLGKMGTFLNL